MSAGRYIFDDEVASAELTRLRLIESIFDPATRVLLGNDLLGANVLEVGAGAGSVARWLSERVGLHGRVVALDCDTRFLGDLAANVSVVEGRLSDVPLPRSAFDLAHARYVLIHNSDASELIQTMLGALRPGGRLVLEEPDFSAARALTGPARVARAFSGFTGGFEALFAARGMDHALGGKLPRLVQEAGATLQHVERDSAIAPGGSPLAEMMRRSTAALADKYLATGRVTKDDLDSYAAFTESAQCWGIYYATVRVVAVRP